MKRYNKTTTLRPSFWTVLALLMRIVFNRGTNYCMTQYREIEKRKPLLKLYRFELRCGYAANAWMDHHPYIVNTALVILGIVFSIQMTVGFLDYICGIRY